MRRGCKSCSHYNKSGPLPICYECGGPSVETTKWTPKSTEKDIENSCEFCGHTKANTHHKDCPLLCDFGTKQKGVNPKDVIGSAKNPHGCISRAVLAEVGLAMMEGARKYRRHNYRVTPVRAEVYFDAANRHLDAWWEGENIDPDSGLPHLTKAIASLFVIRDAIINGSWYDDRPPKVPEEHWKFIKERTAELLKKLPESKPPYTEIERSVDHDI